MENFSAGRRTTSNRHLNSPSSPDQSPRRFANEQNEQPSASTKHDSINGLFPKTLRIDANARIFADQEREEEAIRNIDLIIQHDDLLAFKQALAAIKSGLGRQDLKTGNQSLLMQTLARGAKSCANYLLDLETFDVQIDKRCATTGKTALMFAVDDLDLFAKILAKRPDLLNRDVYLQTVIHHAATKPCLSALLKAGCDLNTQDSDGNTVVHQLAKAASINPRNLYLLAAYRADFNICNKYGERPLATAIKYDNIDTARSLIKVGAKITASMLKALRSNLNKCSIDGAWRHLRHQFPRRGHP